MIKALVLAGATWGIVWFGQKVISRWDEGIPLKRRQWIGLFAASVVQGLALGNANMRGGREAYTIDLMVAFSVAAFGGCLLQACVTDIHSCQVYNFIWWMAAAFLAPALWQRAYQLNTAGILEGGFAGERWRYLSLTFFVVAQLVLAGRIYGKADAYAFSFCAIAETCLGMEGRFFLGQMLLAYGGLFLVQIHKRNVTSKGNLKHPVPFLTYISVSFWVIFVVFFGCFSGEKVLY